MSPILETVSEFATELSRQLHSDALGEGDVDAAGERPCVIIAVAHFGIGRKIIARLGGHKVDRARYGVLAEQGALRPAQHLDALDIDERLVDRRRLAEIDAVELAADAAVEADVSARCTAAPDHDARSLERRRVGKQWV